MRYHLHNRPISSHFSSLPLILGRSRQTCAAWPCYALHLYLYIYLCTALFTSSFIVIISFYVIKSDIWWSIYVVIEFDFWELGERVFFKRLWAALFSIWANSGESRVGDTEQSTVICSNLTLWGWGQGGLSPATWKGIETFVNWTAQVNVPYPW